MTFSFDMRPPVLRSVSQEDDGVEVHDVQEGQETEQRHALMPALSVAQHNALAAIHECLVPNEHLFAFLDDLMVVSGLHVAKIHAAREREL